jgi:hypothetical protein
MFYVKMLNHLHQSVSECARWVMYLLKEVGKLVEAALAKFMLRLDFYIA